MSDAENTEMERRYSPEHLWVTRAEAVATIGVTRYISSQIGVPRHYDLCQAGMSVERGEGLGTIEAAKVVCELTTPVSGMVIEINPALESEPEAIIARPEEAWLVRITLSHPDEFMDLLSEAQYDAYLRSGHTRSPLERRFSPPNR